MTDDLPNGDDLIRTSTQVRITVRELYELVYIRKLSDSQIGHIYNLSPKTIRNYRRKVQFDTTFRTGTMDLPLQEVRQLMAEGWPDDDIIRHFNTTKTSFLSFKRRHHLDSNLSWPVPRRVMIDLIVAEFDNHQISKMFGVVVGEVDKLQSQLGVEPFEGTKTFTTFGTSDPETTQVDLEITLPEYAVRVLKRRFRTHPQYGYMVDGKPIHFRDLMKLLGYKVDLLK